MTNVNSKTNAPARPAAPRCEHPAKQPLRAGLAAKLWAAGAQGVVRAANSARDRALGAQAARVETRAGWEAEWAAHLARTADALGAAMADPAVRELAAESFGQR